jgi:hypothetical protein
MSDSNIYVYGDSSKAKNETERKQMEKLRKTLQNKLLAIDAENDFDKTVTHIHVILPFDVKNIATFANFVVNEEYKNQIIILYDFSNYFTNFLIALRDKVEMKNVRCALNVDDVVWIIEGLMI